MSQASPLPSAGGAPLRRALAAVRGSWLPAKQTPLDIVRCGGRGMWWRPVVRGHGERRVPRVEESDGVRRGKRVCIYGMAAVVTTFHAKSPPEPKVVASPKR